MDITEGIQPMTAFRNHSAELLRQIKKTGRPITLTVNGGAAAADAAEGIRQGREDLAHGRSRPAKTSSVKCARSMTYRVELL